LERYCLAAFFLAIVEAVCLIVAGCPCGHVLLALLIIFDQDHLASVDPLKEIARGLTLLQLKPNILKRQSLPSHDIPNSQMPSRLINNATLHASSLLNLPNITHSGQSFLVLLFQKPELRRFTAFDVDCIEDDM
jgi:hypothetical protein